MTLTLLYSGTKIISIVMGDLCCPNTLYIWGVIVCRIPRKIKSHHLKKSDELVPMIRSIYFWNSHIQINYLINLARYLKLKKIRVDFWTEGYLIDHFPVLRKTLLRSLHSFPWHDGRGVEGVAHVMHWSMNRLVIDCMGSNPTCVISSRMLISRLRVDGSEIASAWNWCLMHDKLVSSQELDSQCHDICSMTFARSRLLQCINLIRL